MKLSNANPVSTRMGDILTQQCSVECSCIFHLFIYLFIVPVIIVPVFFPHYFVTHINEYAFQRNLIFSMKLSNANPVSAWMGERLTPAGAVEFSCIFTLFYFFLIYFFSSSFSVPDHFFILHMFC